MPPPTMPPGIRRSQKNSLAIGSGDDTVGRINVAPLSVGGLGNCTDVVDCKLGVGVSH